MNNYEQIKLNIDVFTKFIHRFAENIDDCVYCPIEKFCSLKCNENEELTCQEIIKQWLECEVENAR